MRKKDIRRRNIKIKVNKGQKKSNDVVAKY